MLGCRLITLQPLHCRESNICFHSCCCSVVSTSMTPWTATHQASLSFPLFLSLLKLMSTESMMSSNHLILCCPHLLLPSIFPRIRVFSNESAVHIRLTKYWSFSFSVCPCNEYSELISFRMEWFDLLAVQDHSNTYIFRIWICLLFLQYFCQFFSLLLVSLTLPPLEEVRQ